ncbi:MAG: hypothetical protein ACRC62_03655 [Microcoleus sp.]
MAGTLLKANYSVHSLHPGKEWVISVNGERIGTIRQKDNLYGWCDKYGGHWFPTFDVAAERRIGK